MNDLTRWNRAGLARFDYLDGNAAQLLERLRAGLAERFPDWQPVSGSSAPADESEEARKAHLEALYAADPDDMLWQITRQFARAGHVLGDHVDAYANEAYLGTASQWESLRRLVALLDYAPRPPASASVPLALLLKEGARGTVKAGELQVKHSPAEGAPLVFETLEDLQADAACNTLYPRDHLRNPQPLKGTTLVLEGELDKLKGGEPLLLEEERSGRLSAHLVQGLVLAAGHTTVTVSPAVPAGFPKGWTRIHAAPKERLRPLGPATTGVERVGHALQLAAPGIEPGADLAAGDIVLIRSQDDKPYYRRIKAVHENRLVFYRKLGRLTLNGATVARPVVLPITDLAEPPKRRVVEEDDTVVDVLFAAGDWSRLAGQWLADIRKVSSDQGEREYLPAYRCLHAKYVPVGTDPAAVADDERPGYTALTLTWHPSTDGVPGDPDLRLKNPQTLLAPPPTAGPWPVDTFLNASEEGRLVRELVTGQCKQTAAGEPAVVVRGGQMAWARLAAVDQDSEREESTLIADPHWEHRGGGPWFLGTTRVYGHFREQVRVVGWQQNTTPLSGKRVTLESLPAGLEEGRALILDNGSEALESRIAGLDRAAARIDLDDPLPAGSTAGNLAIYANVVNAGHGEGRPQRPLGSGDATRNGQRFALEVNDVSFVADAAMAAGVRADLRVEVAGERWSQVSNLKDSASTDTHFQVRLDEEGRLQLQFGDGRHGRRLPSGHNNLRIAFRQGVGAVGNLPPGSLVKPVKPHPLLDALLQPVEASGGADREGRADLRRNAPAALLALDRAVSLDDYAQLARVHASVWQARAFRLPPGLGRSERLEVVVMAAGGGTLSSAQAEDLELYLGVRAQPGVSVAVSDYQRLSFALSVTLRVCLDAFDLRAVQQAVVRALSEAFTERARGLGQPLYRGEVFRVVDGVAGVENSDCSILLSAATRAQLERVGDVGGEIQAVRPGPRQCLVFDATGFDPEVQEYQL